MGPAWRFICPKSLLIGTLLVIIECRMGIPVCLVSYVEWALLPVQWCFCRAGVPNLLARRKECPTYVLDTKD